MKPTKFFTTFQIGKICGVCIPTIIEWINSGKMPSYRTIGGHRRVKQEDLVKFLRENSIPFPPELTALNCSVALIVDDEEEILKLIKRYLQKEIPDLLIHTASTGFEAGQKIKEINPCLLILDIFLPGINGLEVCKLVRSENKDIRIIAISGVSTMAEKEVIKAGADMFLAKPFTKEQLIAAVRKVGKDHFAAA